MKERELFSRTITCIPEENKKFREASKRSIGELWKKANSAFVRNLIDRAHNYYSITNKKISSTCHAH